MLNSDLPHPREVGRVLTAPPVAVSRPAASLRQRPAYMQAAPALIDPAENATGFQKLAFRAALAMICMFLSVPFSSWVGGTVESVRLYAFISFPLVFVVGGLTVSWKEVRSVFTAVGVSGVFLIGVAAFMAKPDPEGRLSMNDSSSTIGNSNDLAILLILVIPFILFIVADKRRMGIIRWPLLIPVAYAFKMILATASRGALIALFVAFLFVLLRASGKVKMIAIAAVGLVVARAPFLINENSLNRLSTLLGGEVTAHSVGEEAMQSQEERSYVLEQSLIASLSHPVVGLGMGQFPNYVGLLGKAQGKTGAALHWAETLDAFTEVPSECGLPA